MPIDRREREMRYAEKAIANVFAEMKSTSSIVEIRRAVAKVFNVDVADILGKSRWPIDAMARQVTCALAVRLTKLSLLNIAHYCGDLDHTCVMGASRKYQPLLDKLGIGSPESNVRKRKIMRDNEIAYDVLASLINWSIEDAFSEAEDILPHLDSQTRSNRLHGLKRRGFAEHQICEPHGVMWRVTPEGRRAFIEHTLRIKVTGTADEAQPTS